MRTRSAGTACVLVLVIGGVMLTGGRPVHTQDPPSAAAAVVEAERAFSRLAGKIGHVAAFLAYFADDVVTFQPAPGTGKERLREAAARMPVPPAVKLDWEPWFADAAGAGDLGYTTGPSVFTEVATGKVLRTGWYFSVWKHDANGWRVAADIGIQSPPAGELRPRSVEYGSAAHADGRPRPTRDEVLAVDRDLAAAISRTGSSKAYAPYLGPASRLYRDGAAPVVGAAAIQAYLAGQEALACRAVDGGVSNSGDLAYSLGECDVRAAAPGKGGFLRVWTRGPRGWLLAADVVTR